MATRQQEMDDRRRALKARVAASTGIRLRPSGIGRKGTRAEVAAAKAKLISDAKKGLRNYFSEPVESPDETRTRGAVRSGAELVSAVRSGRIKPPRGPEGTYSSYVPGDAGHSIDKPDKGFGGYSVATEDGSAVYDAGGWAASNRAKGRWEARGAPKDAEGNPRFGKVTVAGVTYSDDDADDALRRSGMIARNNDIARKTYDVLKSAGVYGVESLAKVGRGRFDADGVAKALSEEDRRKLYDEGYRGLRTRYRGLSTQKDLYGQRLQKAKDDYKGARGFDDFVLQHKEDFDFSKEWEAYEKGVQAKISAAQRKNNPSEVARLLQVAEGRRVQMQEMAQKKAMSAWSGSGAANLWRSQKELEDTLANRQAGVIRDMNAVMRANAGIANQLGVEPQTLLVEPEVPKTAKQEPAGQASQWLPLPVSEYIPTGWDMQLDFEKKYPSNGTGVS